MIPTNTDISRQSTNCLLGINFELTDTQETMCRSICIFDLLALEAKCLHCRIHCLLFTPFVKLGST